jgi:lipopolysaccharide/colanic/teichoic acid biosynthesis glycosyltransferase
MVIEGKLVDFFLDPKNGINRCAGVCALIFCGPLLVSIAIAIRLSSGEPALLAKTRQTSSEGAYQGLAFQDIVRQRPLRLR